MSADSTTPFAEPRTTTRWLPFLVGALLGVLVLLVSWELHQNELKTRSQRTLEHAELVASDLEADLAARTTAFQRMATRWEVGGGTPRNQFESDAGYYVNDMPGLRGVGWVDPDYILRWVVPLRGNERAVGADMKQDAKRFAALERSKLQRVPTLSDPVTLYGADEVGSLMDFALFVDDRHDGFLVNAMVLEEWIGHVVRINRIREKTDEVGILVRMGGTPVFTSEAYESLDADEERTIETEIMGQIFTISCRPTQLLYERTQSALPLLEAAVGLLLATLIGFVVHLYQRASAEAWRTYAAKTALHAEVDERRQIERELQRANARMAMAARAGDMGIWEWNVQTGKLTWNKEMFLLYDLPDDIVPKYETWKNAVHPDDVDAAETLLEDAVDGKASFDTQFRLLLPGSEVKHIQTVARVERDADGNAMRVIGMSWDVTAQKEAEAQLDDQRQRLADIIRGTNVGTWEWNVQTGETRFNERWAEMIGYTLDELSPTDIRTWRKFCHPDDLKRSDELLQRHFSGDLEYYELEARMRHRDGDWVWAMDRGKVSKWDRDGKPLVMSGTHQDITRQKRNEEQIRHLANHDTLTGLPTLRLGKDRLVMALEAAKRNGHTAAVLFIDLDGFKKINDSLGHDAGDALLKETALRLQSSLRKMDTVARIGGDEFLVVLSELHGRKDAELVAEKVVETVAAPYYHGEKKMTVGASVGVALCTGGCDAATVEALVKQADEAMYTIKKSGKNGFAFAGDDSLTPLA